MEFLVLSRGKAKSFSYKVDKRCIFISITDPYSPDNLFAPNPNIQAVLKLKFDDIDYPINNLILMTKEQAKQITDFVNRWKEKVDLIVVHCEAGVSRSAGICAAIMKYLTNNDMDIFNNGKYCPNMLCYRLVLYSFMGFLDEEEITDKEEHQLQLWREANDI